MKRFLHVLSFLLITYNKQSLANTIDDYKKRLNLQSITVTPNEIVFECTEGSPDRSISFFGLYVEYEKKLLSFYSRRVLPPRDCASLLHRIGKITRDKDRITIAAEMSAFDIHSEERDWKNRLLQKYSGHISVIGPWDQVSNGKTCECWFDDCPCLPVD